IAVAVLGTIVESMDGSVIEAVLAGEDIEVLFSRPLVGDPELFTVDAGGRAWTLPASVTQAQLVAAASGRMAPVPALVPIGRIDERTLLVDLEASPVTAVSGDQGGVDALLWEAVASLTTSTWSDDVRVLLVGLRAPGFEGLERAEVVEPEAVFARVQADVLATRAELAAHRMTTLLEARASGGSWTTTVVIAGRDAPGEIVGSLADFARDGGALALLTAADVVRASRRIVMDG